MILAQFIPDNHWANTKSNFGFLIFKNVTIIRPAVHPADMQ